MSICKTVSSLGLCVSGCSFQMLACVTLECVGGLPISSPSFCGSPWVGSNGPQFHMCKNELLLLSQAGACKHVAWTKVVHQFSEVSRRFSTSAYLIILVSMSLCVHGLVANICLSVPVKRFHVFFWGMSADGLCIPLPNFRGSTDGSTNRLLWTLIAHTPTCVTTDCFPCARCKECVTWTKVICPFRELSRVCIWNRFF
jgi:hypothetical protein